MGGRRGGHFNTQRERQRKAEEDLKVLALMIGMRQPLAKEEWEPSLAGDEEAGVTYRAFGRSMALLIL